MCGGRGSRLKYLTERTPKPLIQINNNSILEIKLNQYVNQGFQNFIFCIGYMGEQIREAVFSFKANINPLFSDAGENAGILERLHLAREHFDDQVLMTYGDTFTDIDLHLLIEEHEKNDNEVTIVVTPIQNPFGLVEFDRNNKVTYFKEKPTLNYYIGYAIINKSAFDLIPSKIISLPDGEGLVTFYKILMGMDKLGVYYHSGLQITFNTQEELKLAEEQLVRFYTAKENTNEPE